MKPAFLVFGTALAMVLSAGQAVADPIGPDCGSCYGNIYTLTYDPIGTDIYRITLEIDTSGFVAIGSPEWLQAVSIKVAANDADYVSVASVAQPEDWMGSLSLSAGFLTDTSLSANQFEVPDGTLAWTWDIGVAPGRLLADPEEASVKAVFFRVGPSGRLDQRFTSERISLQTQVPEPASVVLFSTGLIGLRALKRRRR